MTKPKGESLNSTHFSFLTGGGGRGKLTLSVDEAKRFLYIANELDKCADWDHKVDRAAVAKVAKVVDKAVSEAEYRCHGLPFSLPNNKKLDGGDWRDTNFHAPNMFN